VKSATIGIRTLAINLFGLRTTNRYVRRIQRMNMWRRTLLRRLVSCWILKRWGSVRQLQRVNMWRRMLLGSLLRWWILKRGSMLRMMLKRLCRWWIFMRRGRIWRILRWRSNYGSVVYGILISWSTIILSTLQ
jgi:hypothetical protein